MKTWIVQVLMFDIVMTCIFLPIIKSSVHKKCPITRGEKHA